MEELACFEDIGALKEVLPIFLQKYDLFEEFKKTYKEHTLKKESDVHGNENETAASENTVSKSTKRKSTLVRHRRKSSTLSASFRSTLSSYKSNAPPDLNRVEGTTIEEREANLSLKLIRIREKGGVRGFGENKHQAMANSWLDAIKDYLSVNAAMKDWTFAWRLDENDDVVRVLDALKDKQSLLMKQAIVGKAVRCLASLAITTFDNATDFLLAAQFYNQGDVKSAAITIAFPLLSNLFQSLWSFADKDSIFVTFASLLGLKPFIDTWRAITGAEQGQRVNQPVLSMAVNRGIELIAESLPQTCFQTFRIIQSVATNRAVSSLQYFTVGSSFAAIGFIFSIMVSCFFLNLVSRFIFIFCA